MVLVSVKAGLEKALLLDVLEQTAVLTSGHKDFGLVLRQAAEVSVSMQQRLTRCTPPH